MGRPLVSYGGSGLLAHAAAMGLLTNVGLGPGYEVSNEPFRWRKGGQSRSSDEKPRLR